MCSLVDMISVLAVSQQYRSSKGCDSQPADIETTIALYADATLYSSGGAALPISLKVLCLTINITC